MELPVNGLGKHLAGDKPGSEKLVKRGSMPQRHNTGVKTPPFSIALSARLKPCPYYKTSLANAGRDFSATCKSMP
jgi:hypothetical protein